MEERGRARSSRASRWIPLLLASAVLGTGAAPGATAADSGTRTWDVPYLRQRDYYPDKSITGIGESACAPTSLAMLLRFYFPNSRVDVPEIYHAGTQSYGFSGPAAGYRNLSWGGADRGAADIPAGFSGYYQLSNSYAVPTGIDGYLRNAWNVTTTTVTTEDDVYRLAASGPLLLRVWGHGCGPGCTASASGWGHYMVLVGIDGKGTSGRADDVLIVNDPYGQWNRTWDKTAGPPRRISNYEFFYKGKYLSKWFREAKALVPSDTSDQRLYTVVVGPGNNGTSGNQSVHRFEVDNVSARIGTGYAWWEYYGSGSTSLGNWLYPKEYGHTARWTPSLAVAGRYSVEIRFRADKTSGNVGYTLCDASGRSLVQATVDQSWSTAQWRVSTISSSAALSNGAYVRANPIAANSNLGFVKLTYLGTAGTAGPDPAKWYKVVNRNSAKCVDAKWAATANGTAIQQYPCNGTYAQQYQFQPSGGGNYRAYSRNSSSQVWDVSWKSTADAAPIQLWSWWGGTNQQWRLVDEGGGYYHFVASNSGKCLDVPWASTQDSVQLQQYTCNGSAAQSFMLVEQ